MTPAEKQEIRDRLIQSRTAILTSAKERINALRRPGKDKDVSEVGGRSVTISDLEDYVSATLVGQQRKDLVAIQGALELLESGDGIYCEDCRSEIPFPRLKAVPHANRCVGCQAVYESRSRLEEHSAARSSFDDPEEE